MEGAEVGRIKIVLEMFPEIIFLTLILTVE